MKRAELEHLIRAAADLADDDDEIIGSQSILGAYPETCRRRSARLRPGSA